MLRLLKQVPADQATLEPVLMRPAKLKALNPFRMEPFQQSAAGDVTGLLRLWSAGEDLMVIENFK